MSRQGQEVGEGATAYQAGGSMTINQGMSPSQMVEIMDAVSAQIARYIADAGIVFDDRLAEFQAEMLGKFAGANSPGNAEAFRDPDFQFILREAQNAYGRSGDEDLRHELVRLLAERSTETGQTRKALILNEAIGVVGHLTSQDIAMLSVVFLSRYVRTAARDADVIVPMLDDLYAPFVSEFPDETFSKEYLISMRCMGSTSLANLAFWQPFASSYGHAFTRGFTPEELSASVLRPDAITHLVEPLPSETGKLRFKMMRADLATALAKLGPEFPAESALTLFDNAAYNQEKLQAALPGLRTVADRWSSSGAESSELTALGKVVAHSALSSRTGFDAPLDIWAR